ncbi:sulfite exporter TauE/SafE family protein [Pelagibius litoralis]|uniref:Probable membrane transporter protein n=1 Tax=Pelagibius litoralis TaxID=374515 RepID=A0A967EXM7_9PROT|nr:sulfite exporter TauE/SafE family protein [Pelagibius litoralis]NIA69302.1 sulfite exporter TauE/SafE family protein [Pelagibius litoralis]
MVEALDLIVWLAVLGIFFLGGLIKGALGFGLPLVTIALLPLVIPTGLALAVNVVVFPIMNVFQFVQAGMMRETLGRFPMMLLGILLGVPMGALLLSGLDEELLIFCLGLFVAVFAIFNGINPRLRIPESRRPLAEGLSGVAAGILGTLTSTNGPVFVTYLTGIGAERRVMISALGLFFLFSGFLIAGSFWFIGIMNGPRLLMALTCTLPAGLGMWVGNRLAGRLPAESFRKLILLVLFCLGINMMLRVLL